jgi:hypothetical protein
MAVLAADTFIRADSSSGLGTASDGQTWSAATGSPVAGITGNKGFFQGGNNFPSSLLGSKTTKNINALIRMSQNGNIDAGVGPYFRVQSAGNGYFVALFEGVLFAKLVSGSFGGSIATGSIPSASMNGFYWTRTVMQDSHCQIRVWPDDGSPEPGTWNIDTTDSTYSTAGQFGITTNGAGGQVYFDHLTITDNQAVSSTTILHRKTRVGQVLP